jgi:hypothetical protein
VVETAPQTVLKALPYPGFANLFSHLIRS